MAEKRVSSLDGLRGLAILSVLYYHLFGAYPLANSPLAKFLYQSAHLGWAGVDLFFVLSGFLITQVLLKARTADNYYQVFYYRRMLRIFPLYYVALILVFFVLTHSASVHAPHASLGEQAWYWLNISNIWTAFYPNRIPQLTHFWTLAVEEQFYFLWPTVVRRVETHRLKWWCLAGILLPMILRNTVPSYGGNFYYRITPFHMEGLFGGALLAVLNVTGELQRYRRWFKPVAVVALTAFVAAVHRPEWFVLSVAFTFCAIGFTAVVASALVAPYPLLQNKALRRLGDYSYCIYIFHLIVIEYVSTKLHGVSAGVLTEQFVIAIASLAAVTTLAAISYRFFEQPILGFKSLVPYRYARKAITV